MRLRKYLRNKEIALLKNEIKNAMGSEIEKKLKQM